MVKLGQFSQQVLKLLRPKHNQNAKHLHILPKLEFCMKLTFLCSTRAPLPSPPPPSQKLISPNVSDSQLLAKLLHIITQQKVEGKILEQL